MMDRLESIERDFEDLEASLSDPSVLGDQTKLRDATRRYKQMTPIVECIRTIKATRGNADAARELMEMATGEERELLREEIASAEAELDSLDAQLKLLLLPRDPNDGKAVIMEIRGAEGGEEANLSPAISSRCTGATRRTWDGSARSCRSTSPHWAASTR